MSDSCGVDTTHASVTWQPTAHANAALGDALKIVIASLDPDVQGVCAALRDEGIHSQVATCAEEAAEFLDAAHQGLLVLDSDLPQQEVFALHERALSLPGLPILWVGSAPDDFAHTASSPLRLEERVTKPALAAVLALRIKALALQAGFDLPTPNAATSGPGSASHSEHSGVLIAVYGAKGGAGKSTIAVNAAMCLAKSFGRKVLLADVDLWYGDVGVMLNARSAKSLFDICTSNEVDLFGLPKAVVYHSLGLSLLLRPSDPRQVAKVNCATVAKTLKTYCALYDYVLADTGPTLDDINVEVLDVADQILLVTTPELPSIHNCARFLGLAETMGYLDKVRLVVNRANSGVDIATVQQTLGVPVFGRIISSGKLVVDAANQGTSVFTLDPAEKDQFTKDVVALTQRLDERQPQRPQRFSAARRPARRRFSWLRLWFRASA